MTQAYKQLKFRPRGKPWPPGVSANPTGRAKGALNKLSLAVRGESLTVKAHSGPEQVPISGPVKCDFRRTHAHTSHKIGGTWRCTILQDGRIFDRDTGEEILNLNISQPQP